MKKWAFLTQQKVGLLKTINLECIFVVVVVKKKFCKTFKSKKLMKLNWKLKERKLRKNFLNKSTFLNSTKNGNGLK